MFILLYLPPSPAIPNPTHGTSYRKPSCVCSTCQSRKGSKPACVPPGVWFSLVVLSSVISPPPPGSLQGLGAQGPR